MSRRLGFAALFALALTSAGCSSSSSPGGPCQSNRDCVRGESCVAGTCEPSSTQKPQCTSDLECPLDQYCDLAEKACKAVVLVPMDGSTGGADAGSDPGDAADPLVDAGPPGPDSGVPVSCVTDTECGGAPAVICQANLCVPGCAAPNGLTCTGGQVCNAANGHCEDPTPQCAGDQECGAPAQICENSTCVAGCSANPALCTMGQVCNTNTGRCVTTPTSCATDPECGPPALVCESTQCVPGCASAGGVQCSGATSMCNPSTGRCEAPPGPAPCTLDADCGVATEICVNQLCATRCDAAGGACPGSDVCNATSGRCLPGALVMGADCTLDAQCSTGLCLGLTIGTTTYDRCSEPCAASSNCPLDFACTLVSGMGFCLGETLFGPPPATFDTPSGGACSTTTNTCQSGWCNTGTNQCIETCSRTGDCASYGNVCWAYEQTGTTTTWDNICYDPGTGAAVGAACTTNDDCRSGICNRYRSTCATQCCGEADCGAGESCSTYDMDATTPQKICVPRSATAGTGGYGAPCTVATDCESETCVPVDPTLMNSPMVCSTVCCRDQDCSVLPQGGTCVPFGGPITGTLIGACVPS